MSSYIRQLLVVFAVLLHYGKLIITETPAFSQPNNPRNLIIPTNTPAVNRAHMKLSFNHDLCHVLRRSLEPRFPRSSMITRSRTRSSQGYHRTLLFAGKLHEYRRRIALVFRERERKRYGTSGRLRDESRELFGREAAIWDSSELSTTGRLPIFTRVYPRGSVKSSAR